MSADIEGLRPRIRTAIELALKTKKPWKFVQSIELILTFKGIDVKRQQEFRFRDDIELPHGPGKEPRVCLVLEDELASKYEGLVHMVIPRSRLDTITKKEAKKIAQSCDFMLVRATLMGQVGRILGPALGPRGKGLVPIPVNADVVAFVERYKKRVMLRSKEQPWAGCRIGTENMSIEQLVDNAMAVLHYVEEKIKRPLVQTARIYVKTTSSPAIEV
uniref:50S ribosomal protein L1 n=1 Tax=Ignisphaera aggregans TaxID=334771 RepID=A0A7C2V8S5_9CREN